MKRTVTILTIALVGLSACTERSLYQDEPSKGRQIQFTLSPIKGGATRASEGYTAFDQNQTFGTTAFALDAAKTWKDATNPNTASLSDISDTEITGKEISCQNSVWKAWSENKSYYWDDFEGKKLTFLSWSPCSLGVSTGSTTAKLTISEDTKDFAYTGWTMSATAGYGYKKNAEGKYERNTDDGSVDLLLAKSTDCDQTNSSTGVLTQFVHQLCNIKFAALILDEPDKDDNGKYLNEWHITKVELSDIYTQADLLKAATPTVNTQIWGNHTAASTYTYTPEPPIDLVYDSEFNLTEIFPQTLMLPQLVLATSTTDADGNKVERTPKITITYTDINNEEKKLVGALATNTTTDLTTWLAGKSITYKISISTKEYYIDFDADVDTWKDGDDTTINIGSK